MIATRFFLAAALAALCLPLAAGAQTVVTDAGPVRGVTAGGVSAWKGIPYAAPPVGPLRWRAPQPAARWTGVRDASAYGHDCMQEPFPSDAAPLGTPPAEDCLYANVWAPAGGRRLPVVVWIYGGGFVNGGSSPPTYSGAPVAAQGVVFVSFNYRLGRFGTFAHPALTRADPDKGDLGNYGIMDQIAALRWVQRNVAAFGGDPAKVTIIGESAGGMSANMLMATPRAKNLFRAAVVMSGGDPTAPPRAGGSLADIEKIGLNFAAAHGVAADDPAAMDKLRALSAQEVTAGLNMRDLFRPPPGPPTSAGPFEDGRVVVSGHDALAAGQVAKIPVMIGATSADIGGRNGYMVVGARNAAARMSALGLPVYSYRFSYVAQSLTAPGAGHATDIPFFFATADVKYGEKATPRDVEMGRTISRYIVNFARTGDPNGPGLPAWPRYAAASDQIMDFAADGQARAGKDPCSP